MATMAALGRRACAVLAVGSASLHALMLGHTSPVGAGMLALMLVGCLYCAWDLWRDGPIRAWVLVALMNLAMIAVHLPAPAHHHGAVVAPQPTTLMSAATVLALIEVAAAAAVLYVRSRGQYARVSGRPDR